MEGPEVPVVWRTYPDGYVVRSMTRADARVVQQWYSGMGTISRHDLDITLAIHPPGSKGFYIGEFEGAVVASAVRVPWGENVCYGSYYYVAEQHRSRGFGTRLRDEVALEHVGSRILCVDAVHGMVADKNRKRFDYTDAFDTVRYRAVATETHDIAEQAGKVVSATDVDFQTLIDYDNKCFISKDFPTRREFLKRWIHIEGGASYVVLDHEGRVVGLGCRRPCIQTGEHSVGPLYADNQAVAETLLAKLCEGVKGQGVIINVWSLNKTSVSLIHKFGFKEVFTVHRMHRNGDPHEYKDCVYAVTCIDLCGF